MKDLNLIVWITQLGLSVALPLAGFVLLGIWLHESLGWGSWTVWAGIILGIISGVDGLRSSLKVLTRMGKKDRDEPPVSFNDHE